MAARVLLWSAVLCGTAMAQATEHDRLSKAYCATCRVSVQGGVGTGTIFHETDQHYYVLTNAHVAKRGDRVSLEFTSPDLPGITGHYNSPKIPGTVVASRLVDGESFDVSIVRLEKRHFPFQMPVIQLAQKGEHNFGDVRLLTVGCQAGEWPSLQKVTINEIRSNVIYYRPTSRPGRSGSSLVDVDSNRIVGLVAWMDTQRNQGIAMSVDKIRDWINGNMPADFRVNVSLPPGAEPIGLAPHPPESATVYHADNPWTCGPQGDDPWGQGSPPDSPWEDPSPEGQGGNPWGNPPGSPPRLRPQPQEPQEPREDRLLRPMELLVERLDKRIEERQQKLGERLQRIEDRFAKDGETQQVLFGIQSSLLDLPGKIVGILFEEFVGRFWTFIKNSINVITWSVKFIVGAVIAVMVTSALSLVVGMGTFWRVGSQKSITSAPASTPSPATNKGGLL